MKTAFFSQKLSRLAYLLFGLFETFAFVVSFSGTGVSAASCAAPSTDYGMDTVQQSVATTGIYTIWSDIYAPAGTTASYMLEIDDGSGNNICYSVGGSYVPQGAYNWVDTDSSSNVITTNLNAGNYTFKLIGDSSNVRLDDVLMTTDTSCNPATDLSSCTNSGSGTPTAPTVTLDPASPASVAPGGSSTLTWSSTDANSCTGITDGGGTWDTSGDTNGTADTGALNATTTFTLTCTGSGGTSSANTTVTVASASNGSGSNSGSGNNNGGAAAPTISLGLQDGATVSGTTDITATLSSDVTSVAYSVDGTVVDTATTAPFDYKWDTTQVSDGLHSLSAMAMNAGGGTASASVQIAVQNGSGAGTGGSGSGGSSDSGNNNAGNGGGSDTSGDGGSVGSGGVGSSFGLNAPTNVAANVGALDNTSTSYPITLTWSPTDGATGYDIVLDGTTIDEVNSGSTTTYDYMLPADGSTHSFQVIAFDDYGDVSDLSDSATVNAPLSGSSGATVTAPTNLQALPSGKAKQVNLTWTDDDPSVQSYAIYRGNGANPGSYSKIGTSKTTSYGDANVKSGSTYSYYVVAVDAAGDQSDQSSSSNATVSASQASGGLGQGGMVIGIVRGSDGRKPIIGSKVLFTLSGKTYVFTTNGSGEYVVPNMGGGAYSMTFSAPGYNASTSSVRITSGGTTQQNVTLNRNSAGGSAAWKHWDFWNYL